jgi:hypothetical protein
MIFLTYGLLILTSFTTAGSSFLFSALEHENFFTRIRISRCEPRDSGGNR